MVSAVYCVGYGDDYLYRLVFVCRLILYTCSCTHTHTCAHARTHAHTLTHTHTHTHTHAHTVNKRLDEWVSEDRCDIERLQLPRKDSKVSNLAKNSRPSSPDVNAATLSSLDPKKFNSIAGRKRKHDSVEVCA